MGKPSWLPPLGEGLLRGRPQRGKNKKGMETWPYS